MQKPKVQATRKAILLSDDEEEEAPKIGTITLEEEDGDGPWLSALNPPPMKKHKKGEGDKEKTKSKKPKEGTLKDQKKRIEKIKKKRAGSGEEDFSEDSGDDRDVREQSVDSDDSEVLISTLPKSTSTLNSVSQTNSKPNSRNGTGGGLGLLMEMRQVANHPMLYRFNYNDEKVIEMAKQLCLRDFISTKKQRERLAKARPITLPTCRLRECQIRVESAVGRSQIPVSLVNTTHLDLNERWENKNKKIN